MRGFMAQGGDPAGTKQGRRLLLSR
ncbi:hypothetical protein [Synechococcus sp. O70.1]